MLAGQDLSTDVGSQRLKPTLSLSNRKTLPGDRQGLAWQAREVSITCKILALKAKFGPDDSQNNLGDRVG